jgi:hypothetical protein
LPKRHFWFIVNLRGNDDDGVQSRVAEVLDGSTNETIGSVCETGLGYKIAINTAFKVGVRRMFECLQFCLLPMASFGKSLAISRQ